MTGCGVISFFACSLTVTTFPAVVDFLFFLATILPQNNMIKGRVTDGKGEPLIGASVTYKGTNIGTITNMNGEFSLVKKDDKKRLTAEYIGYDPVEIRVDTSRTMLIAMNENSPFIFVMVPIFVPLYVTLAPISGSPFSSVTLPLIMFF